MDDGTRPALTPERRLGNWYNNEVAIATGAGQGPINRGIKVNQGWEVGRSGLVARRHHYQQARTPALRVDQG